MSLDRLTEQLDELEGWISQAERLNEKVSASGVGWHVLHSLKVANSVFRSLESSDPAAYRPGFNAYRSIFLTTGVFPRGRARAPKAVRPDPETIHEEEIRKYLGRVREFLPMLENGHPHLHFKHPYFGTLNRRQAGKFLAVHTHHHLKIIRDIAK